jgi:hypothetical protein
MMYTLGTLSWFWVPVILFALQIPAGNVVFSVQYAQQVLDASGAAFSFQNLVHAVQHMLASGLFQLQMRYWACDLQGVDKIDRPHTLIEVHGTDS